MIKVSSSCCSSEDFIILLIKVSVHIFNVLKSGSIWKACECAEMFVL